MSSIPSMSLCRACLPLLLSFYHLRAACHCRVPLGRCLQVLKCTIDMVQHGQYSVLGMEGTEKCNIYFYTTHLLIKLKEAVMPLHSASSLLPHLHHLFCSLCRSYPIYFRSLSIFTTACSRSVPKSDDRLSIASQTARSQ